MVKKTATEVKKQTPAKEVEETKVAPTKKAKQIEKVASDAEDVNMEQAGGAALAEDSQTVKEKKENAQKMLKAVKKMNAKVKSSLERKQIVKAV